MPDLQSELTKIKPPINFNSVRFDDDEDAEVEVVESCESNSPFSIPTPPNGMTNTAIVMWAIKHNPGITGVQLRDALKAAGYPVWKDTSSYLASAFEAGRLTRRAEHSGGVTNSRTYAYRLASHKGAPTKKAAPIKIEVETEAPPTPTNQDVDRLIDSLTIAEARELYQRLKALFGA